ncbi:MAG TPA: HAD-IC family P-type ATPase [bacterium]|nr:HAD-IC family P-type ATPase [bacterium]
MNLSSLLSPSLLSADIRSQTAREAIAEIVAIACARRKVGNDQVILDALLKREAQSSTALGGGIAFPHARVENLDEPLVFLGVSRDGIDFGARDGGKVHVVFLFVTPLAESELHLKLLSRAAGLFQHPEFMARLTAAGTPDEMFRVLKIEEEGKARSFRLLTKDEVYAEIGTTDSGLAEAEVQTRLHHYGPNRLKKIRRTPLITRFLRNFTNLLAILMWVGSLLAFLVQMPQVGWAIIAVIIINALFSFWQEFKAEKAIDALRNLIPSYARVIRDGQEKRVSSFDVVPGDIAVLDEGDNIPADGRLLEAHELRVDNSVFSGESRPAYKMSEPLQNGAGFLWTEMPNLVFAGTSVVSGSGRFVVFATGMNTEIGEIASLTQTVKEELSPLQREINRLTRVISILAVSMGMVFFLFGKAFTGMTFAGAAIFAIGIILGNVPEGLLPTVSLALAMGVQRMAKRHALIKKLSSVETLGCTSVICTDKTGTLTTNQISVSRIWLNGKVIEVCGTSCEPGADFRHEEESTDAGAFTADGMDLILRTGVLCSTAKFVPPSEKQKYWSTIGDPTEGALLALANKGGMEIDAERTANPYVKRFSFDSVRKRMSSVHRLADGSLRAFVKGAPHELLELCTRVMQGRTSAELTPGLRKEIGKQADAFASDGLRVLGLAWRDTSAAELETASGETMEQGLTFIGLTAMSDPPRAEVPGAIQCCRRAGIRVVMVTGDHPVTALSIARQVGIVTTNQATVITGTELADLSDEALKKRLQDKEVVFARVNPEHKLRVVSAFKELGHIVAVTGDGVNDAPALKRADIGVAMGVRGTDVAREAAEMILTDDNFASIVAAVEEGRAVFENIKKFITYIFAHLVPEAVPFIFYVLMKLPAPITAMQILAIDLGTETLPALALGIEKPEAGIMDRPPRPRKKGIIDGTVLFRGYVFLGLLNTVAVMAAYFITLIAGGWSFSLRGAARILEPHETIFANPLHLQATTMVFAGIVVMQLANVFACRSERYSSFKLGFLSNKLILLGIAFELLFTAVLIYVPFFQRIFNTTALGIHQWGMLFGFMLAIFLLEELRKRIFVKPDRPAPARLRPDQTVSVEPLATVTSPRAASIALSR